MKHTLWAHPEQLAGAREYVREPGHVLFTERMWKPPGPPPLQAQPPYDCSTAGHWDLIDYHRAREGGEPFARTADG